MGSWIAAHLWVIPAVPVAASILILSLPRTARAFASAAAVASQVAALMLSILAFTTTLSAPGFRTTQNLTWFTFGENALRIGWLLDPLGAAMLVMITLVGLCIFVFSVGYMAEDANFSRFFAYLSFFSGAMLGVVIANSLLLLFVFWELVGLASYLLIGFWIERPSAAAAAKKAFITTRIGDIGLFLGILWLYNRSGTLLFYDQGRGCLEHAALVGLGASATGIALLIFSGAIGKSGQFPLHVWLPDAMEGPTPVSALIHAATMVAAGVFLVARAYPIFSVGAINGVTPSLAVVVWIGVITALMGALIAMAQFDIKRILAYSTVSQLGLMMVSLGVGGVLAGVMHLLAHGFFKALLFLGAGSVIYGLHHEQDIRAMGGLRRAMPITFLTYAVGTMALSGVPLLFSGAWTKEAILHATALWPSSPVPYYLMIAGVVMTALYMTRQIIYVFFGTERVSGAGAHESPPVMRLPMTLLAICTVALSVVLTPAWPWLASYLSARSAHSAPGQVIEPMLLISAVVVAIGIGLGVLIYSKVSIKIPSASAADSRTPDALSHTIDPLERAQPALFRFLANKMWIDEAYAYTVMAFGWTAARLSDWMDRNVWDRLVQAFAVLGQLFGIATANVDERAINPGVDETTKRARGLGRLISTAHSGQIQVYLGVLAIGMLALLLIYAWLI